jgi:hypothetical protein
MACGADRQVVGGDPAGDGGEEGIRRGIGAAEPGGGGFRRLARPGPEGFQAGKVGQHLLGRLAVGVADAQVHRAMAAQRGEARVHFGGKDAGGGAGMGIGGPEPGLGVAGRQFLGDGDGFGDDRAFGRAHRGAVRAGK